MKILDANGQVIVAERLEEQRDMIPGEMQVAREALRILLDNFPGYGWKVAADFSPEVGGLIMIQLPTIMYSTLHYTIKAEDVSTANDLYKRVRSAGGEILERIKLRRGSILMPEYRDFRATLPRHGRGLRDLPQ